MGAVAAGLVGFFTLLVVRLGAPQMTLLFSDLDLRDSNSIVRELESRDIAYELRGGGTTVLVPRGQVLRLRMQLAENGLPAGGNIGYELFDKSDALGTTSFVQNINHLRALEGELARTIRAIDRVSAARVHLVLPERELFSRERVEPSAAIVLRTRGELDRAQIQAIRHLAASAVRRLTPSRISIVDETGRLLASGSAENAATALATTLEERRIFIEQRLRDQIEGIVTSIVGPGRARVNVAAELDFNRITETSDSYDPESRVVRSTQTREDKSASQENKENRGVSIGNELPRADGEQSAAGAGSREQANASEEIVNYEISRTTRTAVHEAGRIKRLSVAVLVDGIYGKDGNGDVVYTARGQAELDQIAALVRSAIGFDQTRGDQVDIVNLRFAEGNRTLPLPEEEGMLSLGKTDYFQIAELAVLLIISALVLLFVVRPLVRRIITPEAPGLHPHAGDEVRQIAGPDAGRSDAEAGGAAMAALPAPDASKAAEMIKVAQVNGQLHASSVQKVGELVTQNPDEAVAIVRQWLGEAA